MLTPGQRTVTSCLRIVGLSREHHFVNYHRVLSRACWSGREASRILVSLLVTRFVPAGPIVLGIDDTIERRRGKRIPAKGIYRDPTRSSHSHFVKASGLRWVSLMLLAAPAQATYHLNMVNEVMLVSNSGDASVQFVEFLDNGGSEEQFTPAFAPYKLVVYAAAGNSAVLITHKLREVKAIDAAPIPGGFEIVLEGGARVTCRKLMVATGLVDELPDLPGAQTLYGKSLFHCPYCDGWELRDQPLAVYDNDGRCARSLSLELRVWSDDIIVCTDGADVVSAKDAHALARHGVPIDKRKIASIDAENGMLKSIEFNDGARLARKAIFFLSKEKQHSDIPQRLGCRFTSEGTVAVGEYEATDVRGLYVAGNASHGVNLVIVAAAEGAQAAVAINESLVSEDLG